MKPIFEHWGLTQITETLKLEYRENPVKCSGQQKVVDLIKVTGTVRNQDERQQRREIMPHAPHSASQAVKIILAS